MHCPELFNTATSAPEGPAAPAPAEPVLQTGVALSPQKTCAHTSGPPRRVMILCGDATGNLGDRAIVQAMIDVLREASSDRELSIAVAASARGSAPEWGPVTVIPGGWRSWKAIHRAAHGSDLVICGGGGLFQDDDSLLKMPYWFARVTAARSAGAKVVGVSLGIGPLDAAFSRLCARAAVGRMNRLSVRDPAAQTLASTLTSAPVELVPDPAFLLTPAPHAEAERIMRMHHVPQDGRPLIGVAVRRWFPPGRRLIPHALRWRCGIRSRREQRASDDLAALLAATLDQLIDRCNGHVVFMPSYNRPHEADDRLCERIADRMQSCAHSLIRMENPSLYKAVTARLAVMLGGRMHPTIFAAASGTPVVGLAYNPKFEGLFRMLGVERYVLDVETFVCRRQSGRVVELLVNAMTGQSSLQQRAWHMARTTRRFIHELLREAP